LAPLPNPNSSPTKPLKATSALSITDPILLDHDLTVTIDFKVNGSLVYKAQFLDSARLSTLSNSADTDYAVTSIVRLCSNATCLSRSMRTGAPPIINAQVGEVFRYRIPSAFGLSTNVTTGDDIYPNRTYSWSSPHAGECGQYTPINNLGLNAVTGEVAWNTSNLPPLFPTLWSLCVVISDGYVSTTLEFLINMQPAQRRCSSECNSTAGNSCKEDCCGLGTCLVILPQFTLPASENEVYYTPFNRTFELIIRAISAIPSDEIFIFGSFLPLGATISGANNSGASSNPQELKFTWTPTQTDIGSNIVCLDAVIVVGQTNLASTRCFSIVAGPEFPPAWMRHFALLTCSFCLVHI